MSLNKPTTLIPQVISLSTKQKSKKGEIDQGFPKKDPKVPNPELQRIFIGNLPKNSDQKSLEIFLNKFGYVEGTCIALSEQTRSCQGHGTAFVGPGTF